MKGSGNRDVFPGWGGVLNAEGAETLRCAEEDLSASMRFREVVDSARRCRGHSSKELSYLLIGYTRLRGENCEEAAPQSALRSDGAAQQPKMRCGGKHVPIVRPDFIKPEIGGRHKMQCVKRPQVARVRKCASGRFDPSQKPLRYRYGCDNSAIQVVQKEITPDSRVDWSDRRFAHLAVRKTGHFGNADRGRIQAVGSPGQFPDFLSVWLIPVALTEVSGIEIKPQVRSCSRIRPLSRVSRPLIISASRSGMRGRGRSEMGRISATGMPCFSIMKDSPATTSRRISLVFKCSSRTDEDFMCHNVAQFRPLTRRPSWVLNGFWGFRRNLPLLHSRGSEWVIDSKQLLSRARHRAVLYNKLVRRNLSRPGARSSGLQTSSSPRLKAFSICSDFFRGRSSTYEKQPHSLAHGRRYFTFSFDEGARQCAGDARRNHGNR